METIAEKNSFPFAQPPVQSWRHQEFQKAGIVVDVLRLDVIHPVMGGNKWMKLKGFFEQVMMDGQAGILTKGGPWSNHLHACAWLCNQLELTCHAWVKGNSQSTTPMLTDMVDWNARVHYINRAEFYKEEKAMHFAAANNLRYIPMGGADEIGVQHVSHFIEQLHLPVYDYAICGVGTATTFGGLAFTQENFRNIVGIDAGTGDESVQQKIIQWQQLLPDKILSLVEDYRFGGFARYTPILVDCMNDLYTQYQIPTDIVYTGKLFYAVIHLAMNHFFKAGARLLIIHSGGLQGNRSLPFGTLEF